MTTPPTTPPTDNGPLFNKEEEAKADAAAAPLVDRTILENVIAHAVNVAGKLKPGRELALVKTKLEEAALWLTQVKQ